MAQKISEVRAELAELQDTHAQTQSDLDTLYDLTRREHDDAHAGVFQYCENAVCRFSSRIDYDPDVRHFL